MTYTTQKITIEMTGKTVKIYPVHNTNDVILCKKFPTQTEAWDFYQSQIECASCTTDNTTTTDTTCDIFQAAGIRAPFGLVSDSADMPKTGIIEQENDDMIQLNLFEEV